MRRIILQARKARRGEARRDGSARRIKLARIEGAKGACLSRHGRHTTRGDKGVVTLEEQVAAGGVIKKEIGALVGNQVKKPVCV